MRKSRKVPEQNPRSYEIPSDDFYQDSTEDNEQLRADSFQLLETAPLSIGGHFTFSSEKKWDEDEHSLTQGYFSFNVKFLNEALDTIPLYKKLENSTIPFNREEITRMNENASLIEKTFNEKFSSITSAPKPTPPSAVPKVITPSVPVTPEDNELEQLLNMTTTHLSVSGRNSIVPDPVPTPVPSEVNSDIQEWLDHVLDE